MTRTERAKVRFEAALDELYIAIGLLEDDGDAFYAPRVRAVIELARTLPDREKGRGA